MLTLNKDQFLGMMTNEYLDQMKPVAASEPHCRRLTFSTGRLMSPIPAITRPCKIGQVVSKWFDEQPWECLPIWRGGTKKTRFLARLDAPKEVAIWKERTYRKRWWLCDTRLKGPLYPREGKAAECDRKTLVTNARVSIRSLLPKETGNRSVIQREITEKLEVRRFQGLSLGIHKKQGGFVCQY